MNEETQIRTREASIFCPFPFWYIWGFHGIMTAEQALYQRRFASSEARQTLWRTVCIPRRGAVASKESWYNDCGAGIIPAPVRIEQSIHYTMERQGEAG